MASKAVLLSMKRNNSHHTQIITEDHQNQSMKNAVPTITICHVSFNTARLKFYWKWFIMQKYIQNITK